VPKFVGAIPRIAAAEPPNDDRAKERKWIVVTRKKAIANCHALSPNTSGTAIAISRKQVIARSIGSRVDVVVGSTLFDR
jgi:hypothetical protein